MHFVCASGKGSGQSMHGVHITVGSTTEPPSSCTCLFNPFQTNGIFHKATYYEVRMVYCMYILRVTGYNIQIIKYFFP